MQIKQERDYKDEGIGLEGYRMRYGVRMGYNDKQRQEKWRNEMRIRRKFFIRSLVLKSVRREEDKQQKERKWQRLVA